MALRSYKSLQSSWETEPFSRGAGSDFWASGSLQAARCQNNTPLSGHIHLLLSHSSAQPSSFPHAVARDASSTVEALCHTYSLFSPTTRALWTLRGTLMNPIPSSSGIRHPCLPLGKAPFLQQCTALPAEGQADLSRAGVSFLGQIFSGIFCFQLENSPACISSAAFQKESVRRKYALDMKQSLQYPLICQNISVNINDILQNSMLLILEALGRSMPKLLWTAS